MKKALFVISIFQYTSETFPVLEYFKKKDFEIHVLIGFSGGLANEYVKKCESKGFIIHHVPASLKYGDPRSIENQPNQISRSNYVKSNNLLKKRLRFLLNPISSLLLSFLILLRKCYYIKNYSEKIISYINPDIIFGGPFHSCGMFDEGIAKTCYEKKIPYCCLSVSPYVGEKLSIHARFDNIARGMLSRGLKCNNSLLNRLFSKLFPSWTRERDGERIFIFFPLTMLCAYITGLLPRNPWQKPSEFYDVFFAESEFSKNLLVDSNYDPNKIIVVGKPLLDAVFKNLSNRNYSVNLYKKLNLSIDESFILVNIEPSAEHHYSSWEKHWNHFDSLMDCLKKTDQKIVLSLHPLCDPKNYRFVEEKYGFKISIKYKIIELYPYCRVVVSFPCSTNSLSLVFNKRLIIYDWFGLTKEGAPRGDIFRIPGALYAYNDSDLSQLLNRTLNCTDLNTNVSVNLDSQLSACENIYKYVCYKFQQS